ncbi:hypothetical protein F2Q69_00047078 [Brassica cretica]|uniref:Uncharacterized protein n=1 Tax=Brassica cretica TaxID=69181 RepID=A0A8S9PXV4_BRACR|nr:hypothetical protein F2Q69_00047078 [Brassica cretica]
MPLEPRASWFSPKCVEAQQLTGHLGDLPYSIVTAVEFNHQVCNCLDWDMIEKYESVLSKDFLGFFLVWNESIIHFGLQPAIRTEDGFLELAHPRGITTLCPGHCSTRKVTHYLAGKICVHEIGIKWNGIDWVVELGEMPLEPRASWFSPKCVEAQQLTGHLGLLIPRWATPMLLTPPSFPPISGETDEQE